MKHRILFAAAALCLSLLVTLLGIAGAPRHTVESSAALVSKPSAADVAARDSLRSSIEPIEPLPLPVSVPPEKTALGKLLFNDTRLSRDGTVACATCHDLSRGGADGKPRSTGNAGITGTINTPSVLNAAFNFRQFWNGRAATLEDQIDGPVQIGGELGNTWEELIRDLQAIPEYVAQFANIYQEGISPETVRDAIASYERTLVTPGSRFDRHLRGDPEALTEDEKMGYQRFKEYGCVSCHQGRNIGGNMYQVLGVAERYFAGQAETEADLGLFSVTKDPKDLHKFKVPSLRNIALTAPYFHNGSAQTLEEAVNVMARFQLGRTLPPEDVALLVRFLQTLTGEQPKL